MLDLQKEQAPFGLDFEMPEQVYVGIFDGGIIQSEDDGGHFVIAVVEPADYLPVYAQLCIQTGTPYAEVVSVHGVEPDRLHDAIRQVSQTEMRCDGYLLLAPDMRILRRQYVR